MSDDETYVLIKNVERYPHAYVPAGNTGTITEYTAELVSLKLNVAFFGLVEWDNHLEWNQDDSEDHDARTAFCEDARPVTVKTSPRNVDIDLTVAVSEAEDAFWDKIAELFPEPAGKDLPAGDLAMVQYAMTRAVKMWLMINYPAQQDDGGT